MRSSEHPPHHSHVGGRGHSGERGDAFSVSAHPVITFYLTSISHITYIVFTIYSSPRHVFAVQFNLFKRS